MQLTRSDNDPGFTALGKSFLEKFVDLVSTAPVFPRGPVELRRKFSQFEHEVRR